MLHHHCPLRAKQTAPDVSISDSESETTACDYDTDTELAGIDDDDDSPTDGETKLPTFSMVRTLHESVDVVRVASFPPPPAVEPLAVHVLLAEVPDQRGAGLTSDEAWALVRDRVLTLAASFTDAGLC